MIKNLVMDISNIVMQDIIMDNGIPSLSDTANVFLDIISVNDIPTADDIEFFEVPFGMDFTFPADTLGYRDSDNDELEIIMLPGNNKTIFSGSWNFNAVDGLYTYSPGYKSEAAGIDYMFYKVRDSLSESSVGLIIFNGDDGMLGRGNLSDDELLVAISDSISIMEDNTVSLSTI